MAEENLEPKPGDLIEIDRVLYKHWAVYIDDGYVVHLVSDDAVRENPPLSLSVRTQKAVVKCQLLSEASGENKWRVNNKLDEEHKPKPIWEIVITALQMVGEKIDYNLLKMNCEHFATDLRYGHPESGQVCRNAYLLVETVRSPNLPKFQRDIVGKAVAVCQNPQIPFPAGPQTNRAS
uniref:LRAT domain-containing protein n=1 Tax=Anolis carolinensis TaxID=28377 RepID=A0A803T1V6_ANOCA